MTQTHSLTHTLSLSLTHTTTHTHTNTHTHRHTHTELTDWLCLMMYKLVMAQTYMLIQIHTRF